VYIGISLTDEPVLMELYTVVVYEDLHEGGYSRPKYFKGDN